MWCQVKNKLKEMSGFWRCKVLILHITELRKELETTWDKANDLEHGNVTAWPPPSLWELANKGSEINASVSRADLPGEKNRIVLLNWTFLRRLIAHLSFSMTLEILILHMITSGEIQLLQWCCWQGGTGKRGTVTRALITCFFLSEKG